MINSRNSQLATVKLGITDAFIIYILSCWFSNSNNVRLSLSQFFESMGYVHDLGFLETVKLKMSNQRLLFETKFRINKFKEKQ